MEEHQVTAEGETRRLPEPFFVIATQNPSHQVGTFPLPESQLDRFLMRIELGYPDREAERALLQGVERRDMIATLEPCLNPGELVELQQLRQARARLAGALRLRPGDRRAHAPVAGVRHRPLAARRARAPACARAWALIEGRDHVLPEDVQAVLPGVATPPPAPGGERRAPHQLRHRRRACIEAVPIP